MTDREELIRARAHAIWEAEGCPHGRDEQHWQQAMLDVEQAAAEGGAEPSATTPKRPARTAKAADAPQPAATSRKRTAKAEPAEPAPAKPRGRRKAES